MGLGFSAGLAMSVEAEVAMSVMGLKKAVAEERHKHLRQKKMQHLNQISIKYPSATTSQYCEICYKEPINLFRHPIIELKKQVRK